MQDSCQWALCFCPVSLCPASLMVLVKDVTCGTKPTRCSGKRYTGTCIAQGIVQGPWELVLLDNFLHPSMQYPGCHHLDHSHTWQQQRTHWDLQDWQVLYVPMCRLLLQPVGVGLTGDIKWQSLWRFAFMNFEPSSGNFIEISEIEQIQIVSFFVHYK